MPKLNLRDDGFEEDSNPLDSDQSISPPPTLREVGVSSGGGGKTSTLLTVVLVIAALAMGVFALNYFKVIHLWGKKAPKVAIEQDLPLPEAPMTSTDQGSMPAPSGDVTPSPEPSLEATPAIGNATSPSPAAKRTKTAAPASFTPPPTGSGDYTVQVSSWTSKAMAEKEASRLSAAGMSAFVEDAVIAGENWYRVRVGRYGSSREAKDAADQLAKSLDGRIWVAKVSNR